MGSRLLTGLVLLGGCLVNEELYEERRRELSSGTDTDVGPVDLDDDGFEPPFDCDDLDSDVNPGAEEIAYDGKDNDCDPASLDDDGDRDGHGADDCDDTDAGVHPGVPEDYYNDVDDDCDPATDDDDQDGDGSPVGADCVDTDASRSPTLPEEPYNGIDDDCDGNTRDDDLDGDGTLVATDCDDLDAGVNPGVLEEPYNGVDDDCAVQTPDDDLDRDGFVRADDCDDDDDQRHVIVTYYEDLDLDGEGGAVLSVGCEDQDPAGSIRVGGDCDDGNRALNAGTDWFPDGDGDGFGDGVPVDACDPGAGFARIDGDCDDGDPSEFPAAVDDDCTDGLAPSCAAEVPCRPELAGLVTVDPAHALTFVNDRITSVAGGSDLDLDGWPDVALGADAATEPGEVGSVYVFSGPHDEGTVAPANADASLVGEGIGDRFGATLATPGDVDGDGYDDLLVGAPDAAAGKGAVYLVLGPPSGVLYMATAPNAARIGNTTGENALGDVLAGAGDVDGDGYADWLVSSGGTGKAWLIRGAPAGQVDEDITLARDIIFDAVDRVGASLAATEFDGDGLSDVILGLPDHVRVADGLAVGGVMAVGGADLAASPGLTLAPGVTGLLLEGVAALDHTGEAVAGVDVNGDGHGDVVVAGPDAAGAGQVYVWYGGPLGLTGTVQLSTAGTTITGDTVGGRLGTALSSMPDADGDGVDELAIASDDGAVLSFVPGGLPAAGEELDLVDLEVARILDQGAALGRVGDADRDGLGDVLFAPPAGAGATLLFGAFGG